MDDGPVPISSMRRDAVLALNNARAVELSWLDGVKLDGLLAEAFYARGVGDAEAFLIALDQDARYGSPNFLWFRERHARFVYVGRVVVALAARGRGLARKLYADLFARSAAACHDLVACEVNAEPPNPASDALHAAWGFAEAGRGRSRAGRSCAT
jgi:hypothetical protein